MGLTGRLTCCSPSNDCGITCKRYSIIDDLSFLWQHASFRHPPNRPPPPTKMKCCSIDLVGEIAKCVFKDQLAKGCYSAILMKYTMLSLPFIFYLNAFSCMSRPLDRF
jgi:hypothetical protein